MSKNELLANASIVEMATQLNLQLNVPWIPEFVEQRWIEWVLGKLVSVVPDRIAALVVNTADGVSPEELAIIEDTLVSLTNELIDIPMLSESMEDQLIRPVVKSLLSFAVEGRSLSLVK